MLPISEYVLIFLNLMLPGFIYLVGAFFLIQAFTNNSLNFFYEKHKELIFYISVLVVAFSYAAGLIMHLVDQLFIHWIWDKFVEELSRYEGKPKGLLKGLRDVYAVLIMIRHFVYSSIFLGVALIIWLKKNKKYNLILPTLLFSMAFIIVFSLAYIQEREVANRLKSKILHSPYEK